MDLISILVDQTSTARWRERAACQAATAELFFPVGRTGDAVEQIEAAKAVCQTCPVHVDCLRFALETNQEAGIWGGTSEDERVRIRRAWLLRRRHLHRLTA